MVNETFDYVKYLDLKKSIDNKSLNKVIWDKFSNWLMARNKQGETLNVLEIGAGIGTMIERLLESSLLQKGHYIALEPEPSFKQAAMCRFKSWASNHNCIFQINSEGLWHISNNEIDLKIEWIETDTNMIAKLFNNDSFDLLLSHAVVDLLPVPTIMPIILKKLKAQGACYFSLNFSGNTEFYPAHDNDHKISEQYHAF